jgi:hypothetical protein
MEPGDLGAVPDAHPGSHGELPFQQRLELILRLAVERGVSGRKRRGYVIAAPIWRVFPRILAAGPATTSRGGCAASSDFRELHPEAQSA